jgi:hypothetical protein
VVEEVFDGFDAARGEGGGDALAYAFDVFNRGGEFQHSSQGRTLHVSASLLSELPMYLQAPSSTLPKK